MVMPIIFFEWICFNSQRNFMIQSRKVLQLHFLNWSLSEDLRLNGYPNVRLVIPEEM